LGNYDADRWELTNIVYIANDGRYLFVTQTEGGTRGTDYVLFVVGDKLLHTQGLAIEKIVHSRGGRGRRTITYKVPTDRVRYDGRIVWVEVSYARSGHMYYTLYIWDGNKLVELKEEKADDILARIVLQRFSSLAPRLGREAVMLKEYIMPMVNDIMQICPQVSVWGHAVRLEEMFDSDNINAGFWKTYLNIIIQYRESSMISAVKQYLRALHEVWILSQCIRILDGTPYKPIEYEVTRGCVFSQEHDGSQAPSAWIETPHGIYTIWWQFILPKIHPSELETIEDRSYRNLLVQFMHWRPDIVIAKGKFKNSLDLIRRIDETKVVVIDGKIEESLGDRDLNALQAYKEFFRNVIVAFISRVNPSTRIILERRGFLVTENVNPYGDGIGNIKKYFDMVGML